ncbi:MAG TPA: sigma-70 family RNA polymerase sigma factor [Thermoleophilaceae bacterium]|nr:sigma-70 family RNA polymerase sigma factor [Thermoleophilaceae bacterium]
MANRGTRPARAEIDAAALQLLARHGAQILATARLYAASPEDAEDACQRGLEILLTKAPSTSEDELIPWLKTVVKHEAFALRRQRDRHSPVTDDGELRDRPATAGVTHEQAERLERLRQGAEALGHLKPHEIRALVLKAEGFSYREICATTGWSYTKVNRLLTEGRRAFLRRVSGIERGAECGRYEPLLSALADGEASAEDLALLRPHMQTCLSCRAALREFRAMPDRVASVVPPAALAVTDGAGRLESLAESAFAIAQQKLESAIGVAQSKATAMGERLHAAAELATGQKVAAVAASAAALAGGGTAVHELSNAKRPLHRAQVHRETHEPVKEEVPVEVEVAPDPPAPPAEQPQPDPPPASTPPEPPLPPPEPEPEPEPAKEFLPAPAPEPAAPAGSAGEFGAAGGGSAGAGGEFAP